MIFNLKSGPGDGPVGSIAEDFEEPTTINGVRFACNERTSPTK